MNLRNRDGCKDERARERERERERERQRERETEREREREKRRELSKKYTTGLINKYLLRRWCFSACMTVVKENIISMKLIIYGNC